MKLSIAVLVLAGCICSSVALKEQRRHRALHSSLRAPEQRRQVQALPRSGGATQKAKPKRRTRPQKLTGNRRTINALLQAEVDFLENILGVSAPSPATQGKKPAGGHHHAHPAPAHNQHAHKPHHQVYTATRAPKPSLDPFVMLDAPDLSKKPEESYGAPETVETSYEAPEASPSYSAPEAPSYSAPSYEAPAPAYEAPAPAPKYEAPAPAPAYSAPSPAPTYSAPAPTYSAPETTYGAPEPVKVEQAPLPTYGAYELVHSGTVSPVPESYTPAPTTPKAVYSGTFVNLGASYNTQSAPAPAAPPAGQYGAFEVYKPNSGYLPPPSSPSYEAPEPAYEAPAPAYEAPAPAYEAPAPAPAYEAPSPAPAYEAPSPAPAYEAPSPAPAYEAPSPAPAYEVPAYETPAPAYPAPSYETPAPAYASPSYEAPAPAYEAPAPAYAAPAYEAPAPAYETPAPAYAAPSYEAPAPAYEAPAQPAYNVPVYRPNYQHTFFAANNPIDTAGSSTG